MKTNNIVKILTSLLLLLWGMTSCEESGDKMYLTGLESSELIASSNKVALTQEQAEEIVLSVAWTKSTLSVSDPSVSAPDILATYIQVSTTEDFSANVTESFEKNLSKAYTGFQLNTIAQAISAEPEVESVFYFRLKGSVGANIAPVYSNIVEVSVTPYLIDMSKGTLLNKDKEETGFTLYSPQTNGIYYGFMGATSWQNFFLKEGNGTVWGNLGEDGSDFLMSSDAETHWNFWFPETGGCYYVIMDTQKKAWSGLSIPTLSISGDLQGEMTFDRPNVRWIYAFNATEAKTLNIQLKSTGKQYDYSTGTDATKAQDTPFAFVQNGNQLAIADQPQNIQVTVSGAGEYTLIVDLRDPQAWTCLVSSGSLEPEEVNPHIYPVGINDGITGGWNFDVTLNLYNEEDLAYAGVVDVNSLWGYGIYTEKDNWEGFYKLGEGDAMSGTLLDKGSDNIPAPAPGLYLINTSLKKLTYELTKVEDKLYVSGLNDVWTFDVTLPATETKGVYKGEVTITQASGYGFQIHLDTSWNHYLGGADGKLVFATNIKDDATLAPGTYTLTVDLINGTYAITQ